MDKEQKKQQAMEKIFSLTDKGSRAANILQKHWANKIQQAQVGEDGAESLFSSEINNN
jgi:DNA-binding PadR family transcriptional regulator